MLRIFISLLLSSLVALNAAADWDPALEAEEAAKRAAGQRAAEMQRQKAEEMKQQALAKAHATKIADYRKQLGAEADGRSDAEVERLYQAKVQSKAKEVASVLAEAERAMANAPKTPAQKVDMKELEADTKAATGKSFSDLSKMSDAELEALSKEMEEKYGK